ncbi:MAG: SAM-dependent chlorinase/fluorinase [Pseudomonadota bacterium]
MIVLFTDFGLAGPYTGQVQAVLQQQAPGIPAISLFSDLTPFDIEAAAVLLPAYTRTLPPGSVCLCVVDPGVGSSRQGCVLQADGRWYVGPDEGLFTYIERRSNRTTSFCLPDNEAASPSFHGRDIFAPATAYLARNGRASERWGACKLHSRVDWPDELYRVVYLDRFGNAITGVRASSVAETTMLQVNGHALQHATTFADVEVGQAFWYENSNGLVEIAVNQGSASDLLGITTASIIRF